MSKSENGNFKERDTFKHENRMEKLASNFYKFINSDILDAKITDKKKREGDYYD